jgi:hypothetical protein
VRDLFDHINPRPCIAPAVVADNTAQVGAIIDRQGFGSLTYVISTGVLADADATFTTLLEESPNANFSGSNVVASTDVNGSAALASFTFANDNQCFKLGYVGSQRYTRLTITPAVNSGNAPISAVAILGSPGLGPTVNPPV